MLNKVLALFVRPGGPAGAALAEPRLAVAALLIEAALMHDGFSEVERSTIEGLLADRFGLDATETRDLVEQAKAQAEGSAQIFGFTRQVVQGFNESERIELIEMLWEVAYADGTLDAHEDSLLRRVAGLIHVTDRARGDARLRALRRLGLER